MFLFRFFSPMGKSGKLLKTVYLSLILININGENAIYSMGTSQKLQSFPHWGKVCIFTFPHWFSSIFHTIFQNKNLVYWKLHERIAIYGLIFEIKLDTNIRSH